jgi:hypothetical protein
VWEGSLPEHKHREALVAILETSYYTWVGSIQANGACRKKIDNTEDLLIIVDFIKDRESILI